MATKLDASKFMDKKFVDSVTQFEGMCTAVTYFQNGCVQLFLEPQAKENEAKDGKWIDEQRCKIATASKPLPRQATSGGGHRSHP